MSISFFLKKIFIFVAPVLFQKLRFFKRTQYWPSLSNPKTINEQIFKLKINSSEKDFRYVDKLLVRESVQDIIDNNAFNNLFLPEILHEDNYPEAFFKNLPSQKAFLKANHGSGMCKYYDPLVGLGFDDQKAISDWLKLDYAFFSGERCYSKIDRKLFAEKPLTCADGSLPDDIKVHCYCGKPAVIQVLRRTTGVLERQTFDENWQPKKWFQNEVLETDLSTVPKDDVLNYASELAKPFSYVRVDFYLVDGKLYFSELTLYPASATLPLSSKKVDEELGNKFVQYCDVS